MRAQDGRVDVMQERAVGGGDGDRLEESCAVASTAGDDQHATSHDKEEEAQEPSGIGAGGGRRGTDHTPEPLHGPVLVSDGRDQSECSKPAVNNPLTSDTSWELLERVAAGQKDDPFLRDVLLYLNDNVLPIDAVRA